MPKLGEGVRCLGKEIWTKQDRSNAKGESFADGTVKRQESKMPREEKVSITAKRLRKDSRFSDYKFKEDLL